MATGQAGLLGTVRIESCTTGYLIGYGAIGKRVTRLTNAYEMNVIAAGRSPDTAEEAEADGVKFGSGQEAMDQVLSEADFVLVSTPLIDSTRGLIG